MHKMDSTPIPQKPTFFDFSVPCIIFIITVVLVATMVGCWVCWYVKYVQDKRSRNNSRSSQYPHNELHLNIQLPEPPPAWHTISDLPGSYDSIGITETIQHESAPDPDLHIDPMVVSSAHHENKPPPPYTRSNIPAPPGTSYTEHPPSYEASVIVN